MNIFKQEAGCGKCRGTGIYRGMGEHEGTGVVCSNCKGTGKVILRIKWNPFTGKKKRRDVHRVIETNPGIVVGDSPEFGGMLYKDWFAGKPFPRGSEMRKYTCPAWWYQSAERKNLNWDECKNNWGQQFSACKQFGNKDKCWERFDKERNI